MGATEITQAISLGTLEECKAECLKYEDCTAANFNIEHGWACYVRKDVDLSKCSTDNAHFALFLKTGNQI